jgi:VanZ family protein
MKLVPKLLLYAAFVICLIFLFVDGPTWYSPLSYHKAWDLGHILLFFIGGILLLNDFGKYFKDTFWGHLLVVFIFTLLLGLLTEMIQVRFHRDPDLGDLVRDLIGGCAAVVFFSTLRNDLSQIWLKSLKLIILFALLLEGFPLMRALTDEWIARRQFPVLCDFETPFEAGRWHLAWELPLEKNIVRHGKKSLQVQLTHAKYSTISMRLFPSDWTGYAYLHFSIFNNQNDTLLLICRINDRDHYSLGQNFDDRYNRRLHLAPGWNDYSIPVNEIVSAPKSRKMDIHKIDLICFFSIGLPAPRIIYFDYLYLAK